MRAIKLQVAAGGAPFKTRRPATSVCKQCIRLGHWLCRASATLALLIPGVQIVVAPTVRAQDWGVASPQVETGDRHAGYYYPPITSRETYVARTQVLADSDSHRRIGLVVGLAETADQRIAGMDIASFAKGAEAEKLIMVALNRTSLASIYQARAYLAYLTATARASRIFSELDAETSYSFLDLLRLMGFERLTVSDGLSYTHQIDIE